VAVVVEFVAEVARVSLRLLGHEQRPMLLLLLQRLGRLLMLKALSPQWLLRLCIWMAAWLALAPSARTWTSTTAPYYLPMWCRSFWDSSLPLPCL